MTDRSTIVRNPECSTPVAASNQFPLQYKSHGAAHDPLEREADAMADRVMRMPAQNFVEHTTRGPAEENPRPLASSITPFVQAKGGTMPSGAIAESLNATKGSGSSMDQSTKTFMENRFGADFSHVKIHAGDDAARMSTQLNAAAFTHASDIYFNAGNYNTESTAGKHLLAHELTHVIQQNGASGSQIQKAEPTEEAVAPVADPTPEAVVPVVSTVVDDLKKNIDASKITFDSDSKKKELLGENTGTKITELLQKLVLYISNQKDIRISSIIRSEGHHGTGRAVDIGNEDIAADLLPGMATETVVKDQSIDELIFDAAIAGKTDRNEWNYDQGAKHTYGTATLDDHKDHIHFAVKGS